MKDQVKEAKPKNKFGKSKDSKFRGPRVKDPAATLEMTNGSNDVHWYGSDEILKLAANLSFFKPLGSNVELFTNIAVPGSMLRTTVPGIMFIDVMDTLPTSSANVQVDAINIAAKQQYALIRKANSGAKNYEWNDLIIYEMARSSLNEIYAFLCRAYGVSNTYSMQNKYLPVTLLEGMGFDAGDFISNLASIRLYINNLGKRINSMALPHSLTYFERKAWLYSHIFADASSAKAQYYVINPGHDRNSSKFGTFLLYDPTILSTGGCLRPLSIFSSGNTFADWKVVVDNFVDAILGDDDCAIISGDILKAYGDNNLFKCNPIDENFVTQVVCDYEVLQQIENLTVAPSISPSPVTGETDSLKIAAQSGWIVQDGAGNLLGGPTFNAGALADLASSYQRNPLLNFHKTDVSPADVMVGTRLTTMFGGYVMGTDNNLFVSVSSCGTEIVTSIRIFYDPVGPATVISGSENASGTAGLGKLYDISVFDWRPKVLFYYEYNGSYFFVPPLGDYETYRVLLTPELQKLHETATLYMFAVPLIDNYNK